MTHDTQDLSVSLSPSVWLPRAHSCSLYSMLFISPLRALIRVILGNYNYPYIVLRSRIVTQFVCISQHKCDLMWDRKNVYLITAKKNKKKHWIYTLKETKMVIFFKKFFVICLRCLVNTYSDIHSNLFYTSYVSHLTVNVLLFVLQTGTIVDCCRCQQIP